MRLIGGKRCYRPRVVSCIKALVSQNIFVLLNILNLNQTVYNIFKIQLSDLIRFCDFFCLKKIQNAVLNKLINGTFWFSAKCTKFIMKLKNKISHPSKKMHLNLIQILLWIWFLNDLLFVLKSFVFLHNILEKYIFFQD